MRTKHIFFIRMNVILLSCFFFSTLSARENCDSLTKNGPSIRYKIKETLPFTLEGEKEIYKDYSPVIIPEYFLLGVFPEVRLGPRFNTGYPLATYQQSEDAKVKFLKDYIEKHFDIQIVVKNDGTLISIYSEELAILLDRYLTQYGELNLGLIDTEAKLYSYLSGAYYKSGFRLGKNLYCIYWHNQRNVYGLLKDARCRKILFLDTPVDPNLLFTADVHLFCFEPSVYLRKYLDFYQKDFFYKDRVVDNEKSENQILTKKEKKIRMLEEIFDSWEDMLW